MKHYDINKLINESGFSNYNQIAEYLLNEFSRTNDYGERLEIMEFAKRNNLDLIGLVTGEKEVPFYDKPIMSADEVKANIEEIAKPVDVVPPVNDKVKEILD